MNPMITTVSGSLHRLNVPVFNIRLVRNEPQPAFGK